MAGLRWDLEAAPFPAATAHPEQLREGFGMVQRIPSTRRVVEPKVKDKPAPDCSGTGCFYVSYRKVRAERDSKETSGPLLWDWLKSTPVEFDSQRWSNAWLVSCAAPKVFPTQCQRGPGRCANSAQALNRKEKCPPQSASGCVSTPICKLERAKLSFRSGLSPGVIHCLEDFN